MHIVKPAWLAHPDEVRDREIYSVSISPDGSRLASGGQDCKVRIWSTETIYKTLENDSPSGSRQLCSMSNHNGAVTVVRFSPSGTYLASGSDDRVVLIWAKDDTRQPRQEFGQTGEAESEVWVAQKRLTAHENDVQDLAWSPDGSLLVTVGLDSSIIIWSGSTFEKLKTLNPHGSHVKGITFDPANKYFATASDDRTVKIFRYHKNGSDITFQLETTISAPFSTSPLSTYFRRLSWSPDGTLIAAPNATNGPVSTVALITRGSWDAEISLIGHDAPCEVATFCNRVFSLKKPQDGVESQTLQVIATASQDKTLAIWNSASSRPILVARNVTDKAIADISWSPDGSKLIACSLDGTMILAAFGENELGYPLSIEDIQGQLTRYGGSRDAMQIAESVEQVQLEESIPEPKDVNEKKMNQIMGNGVGNGEISTTFQSSPAQAPAIAPVPTAAQPTSTAQKTTDSIPNASVSAKPLQQNITITKDGKKRLAPQLITSSRPQQTRSLQSIPRSAEQNLHVMEISQPSYALPKGGINALVVGAKRKHEDNEEDANGSAVASSATKKSKLEEVPEFIRPCVASPASIVASVRLGTPKVRTFFSTGDKDGNKSVLEIRNGAGNEYEPTRLTVTRNGQNVFTDYLPRHGHLAAGSEESFWAVATEDGAIHLYSPTGSLLTPTIVLGAPVAFLESKGTFLAAISSIGMAYAWDMKKLKALHEPISLAPILDAGVKFLENGLSKAPSITQCAITKTGKLIVTLNNGAGYAYNHGMFAWSRISEDWWNVGSQFWNTDTRGKISGVVGMAERRTNEVLLRRGRGQQLQRATRNRMLQGGYEGFETLVSIAHLENKLGAAVLLDSKEEFKEFLVTYACQIAENGMIERVQELCQNLLGPVVLPSNNDSNMTDADSKFEWDSEICGWSKHELLKLVIEKIGRMRQVQRVVVDYASALEMF